MLFKSKCPSSYSRKHFFGIWQTYSTNYGKGIPQFQIRECSRCQKIQKRKVK